MRRWSVDVRSTNLLIRSTLGLVGGRCASPQVALNDPGRCDDNIYLHDTRRSGMNLRSPIRDEELRGDSQCVVIIARLAGNPSKSTSARHWMPRISSWTAIQAMQLLSFAYRRRRER